MNISRKWLNDYVKVDVSDHEFDAAMTMSGTKVETTEVLSAEIKNVVVGKVLEIVRHENSDHMWICQVDVGEDQPIQIVTGAWNIHPGDLVPVALHKSTLPGGKKIEKALNYFAIDPSGLTVMDVGASTGGFTDCMLQNGATKVYAVDVGYGQLDWKLRSDERVVCMERTNARYLDRDQIPDELDFASIDVSFISLKLILPAVHRVLKEGGHVACLIKPQFEAGREKVGKKGVVRDPDVHLEVLENFLTHAKDSGFTVLDITFSPIRGPEGNIEYLGYLKSGDWVEKTFDLQGLVEQSHAALDHGKEGAGC